jgi:hypothetical protein
MDGLTKERINTCFGIKFPSQVRELEATLFNGFFHT